MQVLFVRQSGLTKMDLVVDETGEQVETVGIDDFVSSR